MLGADNAGHATRLRPTAAPAEPQAALGKHSREEDSADATVLATAVSPADPGLGAGAADVSAPDSDAEGDASLRTIGDQVAALPKLGDQALQTTDAQPAAEVDAEEAITADSLTVLLSQVRHVCWCIVVVEPRALLTGTLGAASDMMFHGTLMDGGLKHPCGELNI